MYSKLILRACAEACALNDPIMIKKNFFFVKMFGRKKKIKIVKISQQHVLKNIWRGMGHGGYWSVAGLWCEKICIKENHEQIKKNE